MRPVQDFRAKPIPKSLRIATKADQESGGGSWRRVVNAGSRKVGTRFRIRSCAT